MTNRKHLTIIPSNNSIEFSFKIFIFNKIHIKSYYKYWSKVFYKILMTSSFDELMVNLVLEGIFSFAFTFSVYILIMFFKVMIKRDLMLFFTNLITIGYLGWRMIVFLEKFMDSKYKFFTDRCSSWMINYAAYLFLSLALTLNLLEWTKIGLATQSLVIKSLSYYINRKSFLMKALCIIIPIKFALGFVTSVSYCLEFFDLKFYWFFDGIFLAEMGILFIINAKTLTNNIRTYYMEYFKGDMLFMQITLICSSVSYLFRSAYLLIAFIFFDNGIKDTEEYILGMKNKTLMLISILTVVFLTEMLPIASLILTNAFILNQKSEKMKTIGQLKRKQENEEEL